MAEDGTTKRRILPPIYLFAAMGLMWALDRYVPGHRFAEPPATYAGWALLALAVLAVLAMAYQFRKADTAIKPFEESSALIETGLFRYSRNPIYVLMTVGLVGVGLGLGSLTPFAAVPVFVLIIRYRFIAAEERMLTETFGDAYTDYQRRVRRWL